MNQLDKIVVDGVLENEFTCREMLRSLLGRGVVFHGLLSIEDLSHDECQGLVRRVLAELEARENTH